MRLYLSNVNALYEKINKVLKTFVLIRKDDPLCKVIFTPLVFSVTPIFLGEGGVNGYTPSYGFRNLCVKYIMHTFCIKMSNKIQIDYHPTKASVVAAEYWYCVKILPVWSIRPHIITTKIHFGCMI